jgi:hypothetical protein
VTISPFKFKKLSFTILFYLLRRKERKTQNFREL